MLREIMDINKDELQIIRGCYENNLKILIKEFLFRRMYFLKDKRKGKKGKKRNMFFNKNDIKNRKYEQYFN